MAYNILVVDDSDVIRSMIARTLRLAEVPVSHLFEASNGREALDIMHESWIDVVLADINMPVMNGAEMIDRMREHPATADIPVIVVSSEGATSRMEDLARSGITAWVRKPFTPEEIRDVINELTQRWLAESVQHEHVDAVLGPVLETFAYVYPEPIEAADAPEPGEHLLRATITFSGAASGTMSISAPADLCTELAANILGTDINDPDARQRGADTLGEIANIAAGHLATHVEPDVHTDLHPPVIIRLERAEWDRALADGSTRVYLVEDRPVLVTLGLRALELVS